MRRHDRRLSDTKALWMTLSYVERETFLAWAVTDGEPPKTWQPDPAIEYPEEIEDLLPA